MMKNSKGEDTLNIYDFFFEKSNYYVWRENTTKTPVHRNALMDKMFDPRWFGGFRRTYRNFLLIHFFQFRNYTLLRARTHMNSTKAKP